MVLAALVGCGSEVLPPASDGAPSAPPTYYKDVAPLLGRHCVGCHRSDGAAPFSLATLAEATDTSDAIAAQTASRQMPPWPADASGTCNTFVGQRWLSEVEIATLSAWAAAGAPAGDPGDARPVVVPPPPALTPSVELGSPAPYTVAPGLARDEYRCFVVDPALVDDRFITALAVRIDRAEVVHHMQLFAADSDAAEADITMRDAQDVAPGYACDSEGIGSGLRYIGVWASGDTVKRWPDGTGIRVAAARKLVVQFHYHNHTSAPIADRSTVALELADAVASPASFAGLGVRDLALPPGLSNVEVSGAEPLRDDGTVHAARIHMHQLGAHARLELLRGNETFCLLDIPRWDFDWQLFYTFARPFEVHEFDLLKVTCGYDTTSRSEIVTWGESTDDEMCIGYVYTTDSKKPR